MKKLLSGTAPDSKRSKRLVLTSTLKEHADDRG